jgi:hypothetical protein
MLLGIFVSGRIVNYNLLLCISISSSVFTIFYHGPFTIGCSLCIPTSIYKLSSSIDSYRGIAHRRQNVGNA